MKKILLVLACGLLSNLLFGQAKNSKYYIEGDFEPKIEDGKFKYELSNIVYKGISSMSGSYLISSKSDEGSVVFTFRGVKTDCPSRFNNVRFWKWQNGKWQIDNETKEGDESFQSTKEMSMVLVLDYSSSIGEDFDKLKGSAIKFIESIYAKSSNGNVKIGIVLFNTMDNTDKMIYPISGLNSTTKSEMISFIMRNSLKKNTALYYAMRQGIDMLKEYSNNISSEKYDGSYLITFTDGIDNQSTDAMLGNPADGMDDPYFKYIKNLSENTIIKGKRIASYVIGVQGDDVGDNKLFESILKNLSNSNGEYILARNFDQVNETFEKIANDLINKWQDLICYVPPRFKGRVRWTLDDVKISIKTKGTHFIMLNGTIPHAASIYYSYVNKWGIYLGLGGLTKMYNEYEQNNFIIYGGVAKRFGHSNFYGNAGLGFMMSEKTYMDYYYPTNSMNENHIMHDVAVLYKYKKFAVRAGLGIGSSLYLSIGAGLAL